MFVSMLLLSFLLIIIFIMNNEIKRLKSKNNQLCSCLVKQEIELEARLIIEKREAFNEGKYWEKEYNNLLANQPTIKGFLDELAKVAKKVNKDYYSIQIELNSKIGFRIHGYIEDYKWSKEVKTIEEVIKHFNDLIDPPKSPYNNILIK